MHLIRYILIFIVLPALGQEISQGGRFSSDFKRGCAPLTINLSVLDTYGNITRQYFYENDSVVTTNTTYTYNAPGTYNLVQLVGLDVTPKTDTLVIEVLPSTLPVYDYFFCDNREVFLEINDPTYDSYEVLFANNQTVTLLDGENTTYAFGPAEPLSIDVQGMFNNAADNCVTSSILLNQVFDNLIAPDITSLELVQSCEDLFNISLAAAIESDVLYQIEMSRSDGAYAILYEGFLADPIILRDIFINANDTEYCVRINAFNTCSGTAEIGTPSCQTLESGDLNPVKNLYSSYLGNQIQLFVEPSTIGNYLFQRSFDQVSYSTIGSGQGDYTDENPFQGRQYFYRVSYQDTCDATWDQQATSPPFIRAKKIDINSFQITFDPAEHQRGENFSYETQLSGTGTPLTGSTSSTSFDINLSPGLGEKQTLQVIGTSQNLVIQSNTLNLELEFIVYVPKAFTPNGDGLNDRLDFFGLNATMAELKIYSRWGQQIYGEISSAPSWDGTINGRLADEGIYIYEISFPEIANHTQKGSFALLKK